ncbi:MAG: nucleotide-binding protein [Desulfobacteraceae bacterium]|nr:nucleotide-binding protein [Desulfobacteraceae bacterium]
MTSQLLQHSQRTSVFLHFFDVHFLELKRSHLYENEVEQEARIATRIALLYADEILIPAASFFETRVCRRIVFDLRPVFDCGVIWLVGAAANIEEFVFNKLNQYDAKSPQHQAYTTTDLNGLPPFRTRYRSATKDIKIDWIRCLDARSTVATIAEGTKCALPKDFERRWERVPDDLEERAFVVRYVAPLLLEGDQHPTITNRLHYVINEAYFSSYVNEFQACTVDDLIYLAAPHRVPSSGPRIPFRKLLNEARRVGVLDDLVRCNADALLALKDDDRWVGCMVASMNQQAFNDQLITRIPEKKETKTMDSLRSFMVHGHDEAAKLGLKDYLQNTLGLPEPVILHQQPNKGRTVIEKFEECSEDIDVAFVLLTPDDIGGLPEGEQRERARQNVIFELGVFVGRFGRRSGRIILLYKGDLEIPSDLAGIVYIDISNGIEAAGEKIRKELMELRCLRQ